MKGAGSKLWIYDTTNKVWVPLAGTSEGAMSIHAIVEELNDIEDVSVAAPADNEALIWDATAEAWVAEAPVPAAHKDTHDPQDGSDKLDTAAPVKVGEANAIGTSHSFPRADHVHEKHHAKYLDAAAIAAAKTVKLDDFTAPEDNTDLDAAAAQHGLMPKADKIAHDNLVSNLVVSSNILTMANQPSCLAIRATSSQVIPSGGAAAKTISFNSEDFDIQNEFDSSVKSGTADATEAFKLHDADGGFAASDVGKTVWNKIDNTYTTVAAYVDDGELTLTDDIMADTETYDLFFSRYTATAAGKYMVVMKIRLDALADEKYAQIDIRKNGVEVSRAVVHASSITALHPTTLCSVNMAALDYLDAAVYHNKGSDANLTVGLSISYFYIQKMT